MDVSITMITRNAGSLLPRVLNAIQTQNTGRRVEVVAVDCESSDETRNHLNAFGARVLSLAKADFDFGRARNLAYTEARSPLLINLSQDAVPATANWLETLVKPLGDPFAGIACGTSLPDPDRGLSQFAWERNGYFYFTREIRKFVDRYGRGVSFSNSALRRETWERLGLDPQPIGEDFQFQRKLHEAGMKIEFVADAPVLHHHDYTLHRLWLRCRNEGLALRALGCTYSELDLLADLSSTRKYVQWLRELYYGRLRSVSEIVFPVLRPLAVYAGSRFARRHVWP
jgi:rhamnosyltransferase